MNLMKLFNLSRSRGCLRMQRMTVASVLGLVCSTLGDDWPAWRGPAANGSSSAAGVPERWRADQPEWKVALPGKGTSTPIVWKDRIYLTTPADGEDAVLSLDLAGKEQWRTKLGPQSPPKHQTLSSSCNASPVTDGKGLFVYFRSGHFAALELNGSVRWQLNLTERFGADRLFWDQGSSPIVAGDLVILVRMHQGDSWVAGFDKANGELRWQQPRNFKVPTESDNGYSTPVPFEQAGQKAFLVWGTGHLTAHSAADGQLLWTAGGFNPDGTEYWPAIATPLIQGQIAVLPVGRDDRANQAHMFGIRLGGKGDVTTTHRVWQRDDVGVFVTSPAAAEGRVYLLRYRGEVVCLDPETGKTLWTAEFPRASSPYYASPVVARGVLYAAREDGVVFAARVGEKFELLSENPMGERIVATPVPIPNRLLLRGDSHLFCLKGAER